MRSTAVESPAQRWAAISFVALLLALLVVLNQATAQDRYQMPSNTMAGRIYYQCTNEALRWANERAEKHLQEYEDSVTNARENIDNLNDYIPGGDIKYLGKVLNWISKRVAISIDIYNAYKHHTYEQAIADAEFGYNLLIGDLDDIVENRTYECAKLQILYNLDVMHSGGWTYVIHQVFWNPSGLVWFPKSTTVYYPD